MADKNSIKEIKKYFDKKLSGLEKELIRSRDGSSKRKREKDFKYKSNEKQYLFNAELQNTLEDVLRLIEDGSRNRSSKKLVSCIETIKSRNKLIRIADKSPGGWDTVKEYESDSIASDSADEKKIRAAERRALSSKKRRTSSATTTRPPNTSISGRLGYRGDSSARKPKASDICLHCGERGHWKRSCRNKQQQDSKQDD